ncbi:hypothetical protein VP01_5305g1, partial [Puccinia sorghi]
RGLQDHNIFFLKPTFHQILASVKRIPDTRRTNSSNTKSKTSRPANDSVTPWATEPQPALSSSTTPLDNCHTRLGNFPILAGQHLRMARIHQPPHCQPFPRQKTNQQTSGSAYYFWRNMPARHGNIPPLWIVWHTLSRPFFDLASSPRRLRPLVHLSSTWKDFKAYFMAFALPALWSTQLREQLFHLKMGETENFVAYSRRARTLRTLINFERGLVSEFDLAEAVTFGLPQDLNTK